MDGLNTLKNGQCPYCGADITPYLMLMGARYCPRCGKCLWFPPEKKKETTK